MKKLYESADEAVADVQSGSTVLSGGAQLKVHRSDGVLIVAMQVLVSVERLTRSYKPWLAVPMSRI